MNGVSKDGVTEEVAADKDTAVEEGVSDFWLYSMKVNEVLKTGGGAGLMHPRGSRLHSQLEDALKSGNLIDECKLRFVYAPPPRPPSSVHEGSEEGSSPGVSSSDNGNFRSTDIRVVSNLGACKC